MKKHYNVILANATINNGNRGCVALSVSAMMLIDRLLEQHDIDYTLYLCNSGFGDRKEHSICINEKEIKYIDAPNPITFSYVDKLKQIIRYKQARQDKKIFKDADFILDIGQGDSFSDIYGKGRFDMIFKSYLIASKYKKPFCILPQTIGPYNNQEIRKRATRGINNAKIVLVRDKQSLDFTQQLLPGKEVHEIIDMAFFLPYTKKQFAKDYIHVGLNISALLWNGGYTGDNQFGLKEDYKQVVRAIIDYFLTIPNVKIHLIPHVVGGERHIENDYEVSYDICETYSNDRLILSPLFLDPVIAKSYIAGLDFFMGARMHATIGAFSSGVPVVPMAYSRKFNGLFEDTLDYHFITDLKVQTKDETLAIIEDAFNKRSELKEIINDRMNTIVKEREQLIYDELRKFFKL